MGTMTGMDIADRAWRKVNEETGGTAVRWTADEALDYINDAQREIVNINFKANTLRSNPTLAAGSRQDLKLMGLTDAISLVTVYASMNSAGATRIRSLTKRERAWFDDNKPTWHTTVGDPVYWIYDDDEPTVFWIYPQPSGAMKVELAYAASPAPLATLADTIVLPDTYANAIQYFVLFSFFSKRTNYAGDPNMAQAYYALFQNSAGGSAGSVKMAEGAAASKSTGIVGAAS